MNKIKKMSAWLLILLLTAGLTACGGSKTEKETEAETETAAEETVEADDFGITKSAVDITTIDVSSYVTLGEYTGFNINLLKQDVTEDEVEYQVETLLTDLSEKVDTGAGAEIEDFVDVNYRIETEDGLLEDQEEFPIYVGYNDLGEEVDTALEGAKPGDTMEVTVNLASLYGMEEGTTGTCTIEVLKVYRYQIPELTDEIIAANTEYATADEYREALREELQEQYDRSNHYTAEEEALSFAADAATFDGYPQEVYDYVYSQMEELYSYYADMYGMSLDEMLGDADFETSVISEVNLLLVTKAIADAENLELTDEYFQQYLDENYADFGYEDADTLLESLGEAYLRNYALRSLVGTYIMDHSTVTELTEDSYYDSDDLYFDEDSFDEEDLEWIDDSDLIVEEEEFPTDELIEETLD